MVLPRLFQHLPWAFGVSGGLGENCPTLDPLQVPRACDIPVLVSLCCREGSGSSSSPAQAPPPSAPSPAFSELFHPALSRTKPGLCAIKTHLTFPPIISDTGKNPSENNNHVTGHHEGLRAGCTDTPCSEEGCPKAGWLGAHPWMNGG